MSHKAGHVILQSITPPAMQHAQGISAGVSFASVELDFPVGMSIDDRIKQIRHAMRMLDKLEHPDDGDE